MKIRWTRSQIGTVLDETGLNPKGQPSSVSYLKRDGIESLKKFGGFIDSDRCGELQKAKLVGFTSYSIDDGVTWNLFESDTYLVGVVRWDTLYVVLYDGIPRSIRYEPLKPIRYYDNVVDLAVYRSKL